MFFLSSIGDSNFVQIPVESGIFKSSGSIVNFFVVFLNSLSVEQILDLEHPCHNIILGGTFECWNSNRNFGRGLVYSRYKSSHASLKGSHEGIKLVRHPFYKKNGRGSLKNMCVYVCV